MTKKLIRITTVPLALRYLLPGQMRFMKENGFNVIMISADGPERSKVIEAEGCPHIIVPMTRKITPFKDLQCLLQLVRIFKKERPDIVHSHTPKAGLLGMLAAKLSGVKIRVHTLAGIPFVTRKGFKFYLLKFMERLTYASANHVWPNSNSLYQYITKEQLADKNKLKVISRGSSNGVNLQRFSKKSLDENIKNECKRKINFDPNYFYLLFVGRLVYDKGIVELINVFKELEKKYTRIRLLLVGRYEPELDPLPESTLHEINNNGSVIHVNWTEKAEYYLDIGDCFIFPSHREGFPNVLLQAGAMELPVICSDIPGNIDLVEHNKTGLLFRQGDEEDMSRSVEFALSHVEEMKVMADNLFQMITINYKREDVWKNLLHEYQTLLNS